jgi:hypothetical protein
MDEVIPGMLAFGDGIVNHGEIGQRPGRFLGDDPAAVTAVTAVTAVKAGKAVTAGKAGKAAAAVTADIVPGLVPLLDEDFDGLLFAHGMSIVEGGRAVLADLVASRR